MSPAKARSLEYLDEDEMAQEILRGQAWRDRLVFRGTPQMAPGTRLLEIGCGAAPVLAELGQAFPGVELLGIDSSPRHINSGRKFMVKRGLEATLKVADARHLPFDDDSIDHVWMMKLLESVPTEQDSLELLREARRVLRPGGTITAIEFDYSTLAVSSETENSRHLLQFIGDAKNTIGQNDAGPRLHGWLLAAGFYAVEPEELLVKFVGDECTMCANLLSGVVNYLIKSVSPLPKSELDQLHRGVADLHALSSTSHAWASGVFHKSLARG